MDNPNLQRASHAPGTHASLLDQLDAKLAGLDSTLQGFAHKLKRLCTSIGPTLEHLAEALSHVDTATAIALPALLQAIGRGSRQEVEGYQSVHGLALRQQAAVDQVLANVSTVFARICTAVVDVLAHLRAIWRQRAKLDRQLSAREEGPLVEAVWSQARTVADQAGALLSLQRGRESVPGADELREELAQLRLLVTLSHGLADKLISPVA
jgi:hypothetical protein